MAARRFVGRVAATHKYSVLVDVQGLKPKFPLWLTRLKAARPEDKEAAPITLNDTVAIVERGTDNWVVSETGLDPPEGMPDLPVHPVNAPNSRFRGVGSKEVNNVGRFYAAKWESGKAARLARTQAEAADEAAVTPGRD